MNINDVIRITESKLLTPETDGNRRVSCGYSCDLLSWVMAHGKKDMVWITVQTHMNVVAVAGLMDMSAVIIPEGIEMEKGSLDKAVEEGITILQSAKSAYELCAVLAAEGLGAVDSAEEQ